MPSGRATIIEARHHAGRAAFTINGRQFAEIAAGRHGGIGNLAPVAGIVDHLDHAFNDEVDIAAIGIAVQNLLAGGQTTPLAGALNLLPRRHRERFEQRDRFQRVACGGGPGLAL